MWNSVFNLLGFPSKIEFHSGGVVEPKHLNAISNFIRAAMIHLVRGLIYPVSESCNLDDYKNYAIVSYKSDYNLPERGTPSDEKDVRITVSVGENSVRVSFYGAYSLMVIDRFGQNVFSDDPLIVISPKYASVDLPKQEGTYYVYLEITEEGFSGSNHLTYFPRQYNPVSASSSDIVKKLSFSMGYTNDRSTLNQRYCAVLGKLTVSISGGTVNATLSSDLPYWGIHGTSYYSNGDFSEPLKRFNGLNISRAVDGVVRHALTLPYLSTLNALRKGIIVRGIYGFSDPSSSNFIIRAARSDASKVSVYFGYPNGSKWEEFYFVFGSGVVAGTVHGPNDAEYIYSFGKRIKIFDTNMFSVNGEGASLRIDYTIPSNFLNKINLGINNFTLLVGGLLYDPKLNSMIPCWVMFRRSSDGSLNSYPPYYLVMDSSGFNVDFHKIGSETLSLPKLTSLDIDTSSDTIVYNTSFPKIGTINTNTEKELTSQLVSLIYNEAKVETSLPGYREYSYPIYYFIDSSGKLGQTLTPNSNAIFVYTSRSDFIPLFIASYYNGSIQNVSVVNNSLQGSGSGGVVSFYKLGTLTADDINMYSVNWTNKLNYEADGKISIIRSSQYTLTNFLKDLESSIVYTTVPSGNPPRPFGKYIVALNPRTNKIDTSLLPSYGSSDPVELRVEVNPSRINLATANDFQNAWNATVKNIVSRIYSRASALRIHVVPGTNCQAIDLTIPSTLELKLSDTDPQDSSINLVEIIFHIPVYARTPVNPILYSDAAVSKIYIYRYGMVNGGTIVIKNLRITKSLTSEDYYRSNVVLISHVDTTSRSYNLVLDNFRGQFMAVCDLDLSFNSNYLYNLRNLHIKDSVVSIPIRNYRIDTQSFTNERLSKVFSHGKVPIQLSGNLVIENSEISAGIYYTNGSNFEVIRNHSLNTPTSVRILDSDIYFYVHIQSGYNPPTDPLQKISPFILLSTSATSEKIWSVNIERNFIKFDSNNSTDNVKSGLVLYRAVSENYYSSNKVLCSYVSNVIISSVENSQQIAFGVGKYQSGVAFIGKSTSLSNLYSQVFYPSPTSICDYSNKTFYDYLSTWNFVNI